jgi:hypothetical protein
LTQPHPLRSINLFLPGDLIVREVQELEGLERVNSVWHGRVRQPVVREVEVHELGQVPDG